jgi:hypothetical protein
MIMAYAEHAERLQQIRSFADETMKLIQCVDAHTGNQSPVLDAGQVGVPSARYVHCAEGSGGIDEAMMITSGITVEASDLASSLMPWTWVAEGSGKSVVVNAPD